MITIGILEPLYRKAKICAVEQKTSLKALVLRPLEQAFSSAGAVTGEVPFFTRRKVHTQFKAMLDSGALGQRPEDDGITDLFSEDRNQDIS
jgi:hypothetical protein